MVDFNKEILEMKNITIEFPGVRALDGANFSMETGKVQAVVGANGAGKSTLMKVLAGAYSRYTGDIILSGERKEIKEPKAAKKLGIQVVYQEVDTALVSNLTVAENILLDELVNDMKGKLFLNWKSIHIKAEEVLKRLNINISTKKYIQELTLAQKQMVLIARAIAQQCKFLILDEPTAPLSYFEAEELFRIVRDLKNFNVGIIFISHRLAEVFKICDEISVMRDGKMVAKELSADTNQKKIVEHMLGRKFEDNFPKREAVKGKTIFQAINLEDKEKLKNINLNLRQGEIVGIAGLVGAGKTELCKALFGEGKLIAGEIILDGRKLSIKSPYDAVKNGIALVPEERRKEGMLSEETVATNLSAASLQKFCSFGSFLDFKAEKEAAKKTIEKLGIKTPDENQKVALLSGGNQQKVVVGKWIDTKAQIYIFDEPTKGVDIGAKRDIFNLVDKLVKDGKSVIYATCEFSEILGITDRVYILYDGEVIKELNTGSTNEEEILYYSTGGKR